MKTGILSHGMVLCFLFCTVGETVLAQRLKNPQVSPEAAVMQVVGLTTITITYHRPGVKGRTIWGDLVPYDKVWRVGANENTTIAFNTPVTIGGKALSAGTYGLHMIPGAKSWTIILSTNADSWGSYFYDEKEDAVRIEATPEPAEMTERLLFAFGNLKEDAVDVVMTWEKLQVRFTVAIDLQKTILDDFRSELRGIQGFRWEALQQGAAYCLKQNTNLDEAMEWVDRSIASHEAVSNVLVKAQLLDKMGNKKDADAAMARALAIVETESDLNQVGYYYLGKNQFKDALDIMKRNVKQHPNSWNAFDSLGEAFEKAGDKKAALENYRKALGMTQDEEQKGRIQKSIQGLVDTR